MVVGELCMTAMIDLWKEHTPKGLLKSFELLTHTQREEEREWGEGRTQNAEEFKAVENSFRMSSYNLILNVLIDWPKNGTRSKP